MLTLHSKAQENSKGGFIIDIEGRLPSLIEGALFHALKNSDQGSISDQSLAKFRTLIRQRHTPNYANSWPLFNYLYFASNFIKSYIVGRAFDLGRYSDKIEILDLGCGSGASIAGFISGLYDQNRVMPPIARIHCVDRCSAQLQALKTIVFPWMQELLPRAEIFIDLNEIEDFIQDTTSLGNLVIMSYVSSELTLDKNSWIRNQLNTRLSNRTDSLQIIESHPEGNAIQVESLDGQVSVAAYDNVSIDLSILETLGFSERPKFAYDLASEDILRRYFETWKSHSLGDLRKIFDTSATYEILGVKTLTGIDEIVEYWIHNEERQANVTSQYNDVNISRNKIFASWSAEFDRVDVSEHRSLVGLVWLTIKHGKIVRLVESYNQTIKSLGI
jgi:hypothetical protein